MNKYLPLWSIVTPLAACALLAAIWGLPGHWFISSVAGVTLIGAVLVAVHHAEVIAHRVGEPFGALVLALAVTIIEASLIVSMMLAGGEDAATLARDTVYATVMIVCNGVIGLCLLVGAMRHKVIDFRVEGTMPALAVLTTLVTLTLILPIFTSSSPGPTYSAAQLGFAAMVSLVLWGIFVFVQTVRHRDYFVSVTATQGDSHATAPTTPIALGSLGLLLVALVAVIGLAKVLAPTIEAVVNAAGLPIAVVGIVIALIVLLPETLSAVRAASGNRMQTSFNLALGSALATIGLTIPAVAIISIALNIPLDLGLAPKEIALMVLTILLTAMTLSGGRATVLQGANHLVVFAVFLFLAMVP
jgi:Ca2+:H+ antiporter